VTAGDEPPLETCPCCPSAAVAHPRAPPAFRRPSSCCLCPSASASRLPLPPNRHRRPIAAALDPPLPARLPAAGAHLLLPPTRRRRPTSFWRGTGTAVRLQPPPTCRGRASAAAARLSLPPTCLRLSSASHHEPLPSHLLPRLVLPSASTRTHYRPAPGARPHLCVSLAHSRGMATVLAARTIAAAGAYGLRGGGGGASETVKSAGDACRWDLSLAETLLFRGLDVTHRRPHNHAVGHCLFWGVRGDFCVRPPHHGDGRCYWGAGPRSPPSSFTHHTVCRRLQRGAASSSPRPTTPRCRCGSRKLHTVNMPYRSHLKGIRLRSNLSENGQVQGIQPKCLPLHGVEIVHRIVATSVFSFFSFTIEKL